MSDLKCVSCNTELKDSYIRCPICGMKVNKKSADSKKEKSPKKLVLLIFVVMSIFLFFVVSGHDGSSEDSQNTKLEKEKTDAECRVDLQCWGDKYVHYAESFCEKHIERLAKYSSRWTDGWLEKKFSRLNWLDQEKGTISYFGDKIEMQNGFGAWSNQIYRCDFNPFNNDVLFVTVEAGRLD